MEKKKAGKVHQEDSEEEEPLPGFPFGDYVKNKKLADLILMGIACNVTGDMRNTNATDKACLELVVRAGASIEKLREEHLEENFTRFQFTSK